MHRLFRGDVPIIDLKRCLATTFMKVDNSTLSTQAIKAVIIDVVIDYVPNYC
jgi:hypothetical protein